MTTANMSEFLRRFSVEVTPKQIGRFDDLRALLPAGTTVYIAHIDGTPFDDMIAAATRIRNEGMRPMPHFPARIIPSREEFETWVKRYAGEAGVDAVLAIAGGIGGQKGPFTGSMDLLEIGVFDANGIKRIAVAGHPEGNRDIGDAGIAEALTRKNAFAERTDACVHITTQFCFEAAPVIDWANGLRAAGNTLPIHIGVAGPARLTTLIKYATMCGVGNSMRVLTRQARNVTRLMTVSGPDEFVGPLADHVAELPDGPICQLHFFPLGGLQQTADWITDNRGGLAAQLDKSVAIRQVA